MDKLITNHIMVLPLVISSTFEVIVKNNCYSLGLIIKPNCYSLEVLIIATLVTNVIFVLVILKIIDRNSRKTP